MPTTTSSQSHQNYKAVRTLLTLDYEVFFGRRAGTVSRTLLEPTQALLQVARRHGARLVFFVDAGFLLRLGAERHKAAALRADYDAVRRQVEALARAGHEIQLHIHPHWEDARWTQAGWRMDTRRYALHAFPQAQVGDIVRRYQGALRALAGPQAAFAYRAGGWVIQPFRKLRAALLQAGVTIDSTVFRDGRSAGAQPFDFRGAPRKSRWRFDEDPLVEAPDGPFLEVPIASHRVGPLFYWHYLWARKLGGARHRPFGDGAALAPGRADLLRKLASRSASVVSMDGYKASFLGAAAAACAARGQADFVVIGHPKALTPYSLERLDAFLGSGRAGEVTTFSSYHTRKEGGRARALAA